MEPQLWETIFKSMVSQGSVALLLFGVVWWLNRNNDKLLTELKAERIGRFTLIENELVICKADRAELNKQVGLIQNQIIDIYKSRDARATAEIQKQPTNQIL